MPDVTVEKLSPEAALAVADYHMSQARALYAEYGHARRKAELQRNTRDGLRKARERLDSFFLAVETCIAALQTDAAKVSAKSARNALRERAASTSQAELTRLAVDQVAQEYEFPATVAMGLYRIRKARALKREKLQRDRQILELYALGKTDSEIGDALGLHPRSVNRLLSETLGKVGTKDRSAAAARKAIADIDRELEDQEPKEEAAILVPPPAVLEDADLAGSDDPIAASILRFRQIDEERADMEERLARTFGAAWESDSSPEAIAGSARIDALDAEQDRLWRLILTTPSISQGGLCAKLDFLDELLEGSSFQGGPEDLTRAIIEDARRLAGAERVERPIS
ncbi:MAG: hypothetical protein BroJett029_26950 [Alphaproteobacteria bacterium]|nr:MAG: hypothetical protein BroJett029_26950 [Alphaproteobacteria bacterium]